PVQEVRSRAVLQPASSGSRLPASGTPGRDSIPAPECGVSRARRKAGRYRSLHASFKMRSNVVFAILLSLAAAVGELRAQQPVAADSLDPVEVEGITVTVLRTPLPISRTAYAVSMNGGLAADGSRPGLGLDEALRTIPGVQVDNRYNYALGERI